MSEKHDQHEVHEATQFEASNGEGTLRRKPQGTRLNHPVLDGSTEYYGEAGREANPRFAQEDPGLVRHPETGEKTPVPDETS